jgi:spore coat protein JC
MWIYEKKLEFPVKIKNTDARVAKIVMEQYGGPDGEMGASLRYLSQRFTMVTDEAKAILNDIGTEELAHLEMVGTMVQQLTSKLTTEQIIKGGYDAYYVGHGVGVYPSSASGNPFSAAAFQSKGDPIADLHENMAAEQKARATYEYIMKMCDDPDVISPLKFLREREIVHFQRFGEALRIVQNYMDRKRY